MDTNESLEANEIGELFFRSKGIMKGYIASEASTKSVIDDQGWLHSGDLGYYTVEGDVYIVDRLEVVFFCRRYRVCPTELEDVIQSLPGVKDVGVVGVPDEEDESHALALVVREPGSAITERIIIDYIKGRFWSRRVLLKK